MKCGFYTLAVLPATKPSMSKHRRQLKALTLTSGLAHPFFIHHRTRDGRGVAASALAPVPGEYMTNNMFIKILLASLTRYLLSVERQLRLVDDRCHQ